MNTMEPTTEHLISLVLLYEQEGIRLLSSNSPADEVEYLGQAELNFMQAYTMSSKLGSTPGAAQPPEALMGELADKRLFGDLSPEVLISFRVCAAAVLGHMRSKVHRELIRSASTRPTLTLDYPLHLFMQLAGKKSIDLEKVRAELSMASRRALHPRLAKIADIWIEFLAQTMNTTDVTNLREQIVQTQSRIKLLMAGEPAEEFVIHLTQLLALAAAELSENKDSATDARAGASTMPLVTQRMSFA